jgi:hypothetical protein
MRDNEAAVARDETRLTSAVPGSPLPIISDERNLDAQQLQSYHEASE